MLRKRLNTLGRRHEYELPGKGECASGRAASRILRPGASRQVIQPCRTEAERPAGARGQLRTSRRPSSRASGPAVLWTTAISDNRRNRAERRPGASEAPERYPWLPFAYARALRPTGALKLNRSPKGPRMSTVAHRRRLLSTSSCLPRFASLKPKLHSLCVDSVDDFQPQKCPETHRLVLGQFAGEFPVDLDLLLQLVHGFVASSTQPLLFRRLVAWMVRFDLVLTIAFCVAREAGIDAVVWPGRTATATRNDMVHGRLIEDRLKAKKRFTAAPLASLTGLVPETFPHSQLHQRGWPDVGLSHIPVLTCRLP